MYLFGEHLRQRGQDLLLFRWIDAPKPPDKPRRVNRPGLVEHDLARLPLEPNRYTRRVWSPFGCHGGYDDCGDMLIHLVGGDHQAWSGLPDLTPDGGIERDQVDLEAVRYHSHSSSSQRPATG